MGVRMSWEMAVMSSLLASQARRSLPMRWMTAWRIWSMSAARAAISSPPETVMGPSRSPPPMAPASRLSCTIRLVTRRM